MSLDNSLYGYELIDENEDMHNYPIDEVTVIFDYFTAEDVFTNRVKELNVGFKYINNAMYLYSNKVRNTLTHSELEMFNSLPYQYEYLSYISPSEDI